MEAEASTSNDISRATGHYAWVNWLEYTSNNTGNGGYVRVNTVGYDDLTLPAEGARLDFDIDFVKTGVHYVHLRYRASSVDNNVVHLYMDGTVFSESFTVPVSTAWAWDRSPTTFTINSVGTHTLTLFHGKDGMDLDRIVITTDPDFVLTDFGPDPTENGTNNTRGFNERVETHMDYRTGQGIATIEAEHYTYHMSGLLTYDCEPWVARPYSTASGETYMMVDDLGTSVPLSQVWEAPLLDYEVSSVVSGTYYLFIRHWAYSNNANSVFVSTNYQSPQEVFLPVVNNWTWQRISLGNVTPYNGSVILSIIMREDGFPIDKLVMTTDPNLNPTGVGPAETIMEPARLVYQQSTSGHHLVQLPMEIPSRRLAGTGAYANLKWSTLSDPSANGGAYAMVEDPTSANYTLNNNLSYQAPVQDFVINFNQTGTHYIYARHKSPNGSDNSYTYLFDNTKVLEVHLNTYSPDAWRFYEDLPTINVPSTGLHTFSVAMREDGTPLDHFTISTNPALSAATLPADLLAFHAKEQGRANRIEWSTTREEQTLSFHLERSTRGSSEWTVIGSVAAAGNSIRTEMYSYVDDFPPTLAYYRLVTEDADGATQVSSVITVVREDVMENRMSIYPNPVQDIANVSLTLDHPTALTLRLYTIGGRAIAVREVEAGSGETRLELPVDRLTPGVYTLSAELPDAPPVVSPLYVVR